MRVPVLASIVVMVCSCAAVPDDAGDSLGADGAPTAARRPNFLVIITDDQKVEATDEAHGSATTYGSRFMPRTWARIFERGVEFRRAYVTTSVCNASRASIYTGNYARHTNVIGNHRDNGTWDPSLNESVAERLQRERGYFTGMVGKWLNTNAPDNPFPEFDFWAEHDKSPCYARCAPGAICDRCWYDPDMYVKRPSGTEGWERPTGYITNVYRDYAIEFFRSVPTDTPFLLFLAPRAPHNPHIPALGDRDLYAGLDPFRPPSYDEADVSDKPAWVQELEMLASQGLRGDIDQDRLQMLRTLASVDRMIDDVLTELHEEGKLASTAIFFTSDNGYVWGEHRLAGKNVPYLESHHVPFGFRYDALGFTPRSDRNHLIANIDITPTIYALAGLSRAGADGSSFVPILTSPVAEWRRDLVTEGFARPMYVAIITGRQNDTLTNNEGQRNEYYDLDTDPYQLVNAYQRDDNARRVQELGQRLRASCDEIRDPVPRDAAWACP